jgi:hypothetical protein
MVKCGFFSVISVISSFVIQCRQLPSQQIAKWFKYTRNPSMQKENVVIVPQSAVLKPKSNPSSYCNQWSCFSHGNTGQSFECAIKNLLWMIETYYHTWVLYLNPALLNKERKKPQHLKIMVVAIGGFEKWRLINQLVEMEDMTTHLSPWAFPSKQWQILLPNTTVNPNQPCITSMVDCCVVIGVFIVMDNLDQLEKRQKNSERHLFYP